MFNNKGKSMKELKIEIANRFVLIFISIVILGASYALLASRQNVTIVQNVVNTILV